MADEATKPTAADPAGDAFTAGLFSSEPSRRSMFWRYCQTCARIGTTLMFDFKVFGMENVPQTGGAILASNHQSHLDPVLLGVRLSRPLTYMAKVELFKNPAFGWLIRSLHAFPVRRGAGDVGAMKQAIQLLQAGYLLNFFPEGTRTRDGEIGPVQPGIALVVKRAGVPVIPAAIDGAYQSMSRGSAMFRPIPIHLQYGPAIDFAGMKADIIISTLGDTLKKMLVELRERRSAIEKG
jgi:1-acyl-sn-glycerol-3-phosphate acyltransferase